MVSFILIFCRYSVDKLDVEKVFVLSLALQIDIEGDVTAITILSDINVPIPGCNEDASFTLPGDGSIQGFVRAVGENFGQAAVQAVFRKLGLEVSINRVK